MEKQIKHRKMVISTKSLILIGTLLFTGQNNFFFSYPSFHDNFVEQGLLYNGKTLEKLYLSLKV